MSSAVAICNLALTRIGAQTINALTEASPAGRACNRLYEPAVDALLSLHPWRFARRRTVLAVDATATSAEWSYVYALPSDCLTALYLEPFTVIAGTSIFRDGDFIQLPETYPLGRLFEVRENRRLLTNIEDAVLIYTARVTDPTQLPPLFREALAWRLATDLSMALKSDEGKSRAAMDAYMQAEDRARARDADQGGNFDTDDARWVKARV